MILEDEQKTCEYPVHPLIPSRRSVLAFASTSVETETLASWMEAASAIPDLVGEDRKVRLEFSIPREYSPVAAAAVGYPGSSAELSEKLRKKIRPRESESR
jgi:hypothetical protein